MRLALVGLSIVALGCSGGAREGASERAEPRATASSTSEASLVEIPEGRATIGSVPGTAGRDKTLEANRVPVELEAFSIEREPRVASALSRDEAARVCEQSGRRLCGELEWERACGADAGRTFPTGGSLDVARCGVEPCASSFGVEALGTRAAEWTSDSVEANGRRLAVVRGGSSSDPSTHRCAARRLVDPQSRDPSVVFRCCDGDPNEARYPDIPRSERTFATVDVSSDRLREILAAVPELSAHAAGFRLYGESERAPVVARAAARTPPIVVPTERIVRGVLEWSPTPHDRVWVFAGRSARAALVAVLHPLGDGGFAHAASLVMPDESSAVVVVRRDPAARSLGFSTCFGCGGEDGEILLREDGRFAVVTR